MAIRFLYIIDENKYLQHYKKGFIKYIPEFLLPQFKPTILEEIKKEGTIIGKVGAVNLKSIDFKKKDQLNNFIKSIKKIQDEDCGKIFIEGYMDLDVQLVKVLKEDLNIFLGSGNTKKISDLYIVVKEFFKILKEDIRNKEVLILSDNKDKAKRTIKKLSKEVRFITVYGLSEEEEEELYISVLDEIGLSIYHTKDFYNTAENYSIIINFLDGTNFRSIVKKKNAIIFDFVSRDDESCFIKDYGYDFQDTGIKTSKCLQGAINTKMAQFLSETGIENIKPNYIITKDNKYYTFKDYIELFIKVRGSF